MTREEAIKLLEHISIAYTPTDAYGDYDDPQPYEEAIDMAIEALSADAEPSADRYEEAYWDGFHDAERANHRWIPVEERLPETNNGRYLVFYWLMENMPWISIMYYGKPTFPEKDHPCFYASDDEYGDVEYDEVVAWMPLPKPWEGDADDKE